MRFAKTLEHIIHIDYYYHQQPPSYNNSPNLNPYTTLPSTTVHQHDSKNNTHLHHLTSVPYMQNYHTDNDTTSTYDAYQNKALTKWPLPTVTTARSSTTTPEQQSILKVRLWSEQLVKGTRPRLKQRLWPSTLRRLQQHQPQLHLRPRQPSSSVRLVQNRQQLQPQRLRPRLESSKFQASQNHDDTEKSSACWLLLFKKDFCKLSNYTTTIFSSFLKCQKIFLTAYYCYII